MTAKREQAFRNAVASARMEGLRITPQTEQDCKCYLEGKMDTETPVQKALERYRGQNAQFFRQKTGNVDAMQIL